MLNISAPGFSREAVVELSRHKGEPEWMLQKRLQAWESYQRLAAPLGRRGDLGTRRTLANFNFSSCSPISQPSRANCPPLSRNHCKTRSSMNAPA